MNGAMEPQRKPATPKLSRGSSHLLKLLDLRLLKHGEDVGVSSLCGPPLGFLGGLLGGKKTYKANLITEQFWAKSHQETEVKSS